MRLKISVKEVPDEPHRQIFPGGNMEITQEMKEYFKLRTRAHLYLVHKYSNLIANGAFKGVDVDALNTERDEHDQFKWQEPELSPYIWITWNYYCKRKNIPLDLPADIKEKMHEATFHHIKNHAHHPEFWDAEVTINSLNKCDRDTPSAGRKVDGSHMPLTFIAAMVADWLAMSEELGTSPNKWAEENINIRWDFTDEQTTLIYKIIDRVWWNK